MAVEIQIIRQGGQMGHGGVGEGAVGVAAKHHLETAGAGGMDHFQSFREATGLHQFDVDAVHAVFE